MSKGSNSLHFLLKASLIRTITNVSLFSVIQHKQYLHIYFDVGLHGFPLPATYHYFVLYSHSFRIPFP
ncbi:hypothetical protein VIM7927_01716 [Vibrio mangrovi]|uniref:Uncharacterized protein n=1 Tax=Vibrio mangrovi TaxID=474394 RepID=A0A1Y6IUF4_9VIBR|nr:hypothetical protein VIM7927_01716 [Vibrio mangrovi]